MHLHARALRMSQLKEQRPAYTPRGTPLSGAVPRDIFVVRCANTEKEGERERGSRVAEAAVPLRFGTRQNPTRLTEPPERFRFGKPGDGCGAFSHILAFSLAPSQLSRLCPCRFSCRAIRNSGLNIRGLKVATRRNRGTDIGVRVAAVKQATAELPLL